VTLSCVEDNEAITLYETKSCNAVMEVASHFKMLSPETHHTIRQNAMRNYLLQTVVYYELGLSSIENVYDIWKMMTSTLLLLDGLKGSIDVEEGKGGSLSDAVRYILPLAVRAIGGWQPGQYIIQKAFPFTNQGGTTNADASNRDLLDDYNESEETNTRKYLTWGSIVYILNSIGKDMFNDILQLMGVRNARVVEKDDKYYLEIDNKVYWPHYDRINGCDDLNAAGVIGWDYINANYNCKECRDKLLKSNWNEEDNEWVVDEEELEYPLQTTRHTLATLYTDVDMSNNEKQLMKSRFTALQSKLKEGLEDDYEFKQHLNTFSTPRRWNELNKFFEHINTLDDICDDDTYIFKEKYCIPTKKHHTDVHRYFERLRTRDSISKQLMRDAMKGTKYEHLVDIEKYKDLCYEMEVARAQQKGGARASTGRTRNEANAAGGGETVFAEEDFPEDSDDE